MERLERCSCRLRCNPGWRSMFTEVRLGNFKAYESQTIPLRRLTILVGPNNAGKSSILQSVLMLKQTLESKGNETLITAGSEVDLGTVGDIVRDPSPSKCFTIGLAADISSPRTAANSFALDFRREADSHAAVLAKAVFRYNDKTVYGAEQDTSGKLKPVGIDSSAAKHVDFTWNHFFPLAFPRASKDNRVYASSFDLYRRTSDTLHAWSDLFSRTWHVAPLRQEIPRFASLGKMITADQGAGGESLLLALHNTFATNGSTTRLVDKVNNWISEHDLMVKNLELRYLDSSRALFSLIADDAAGSTGINAANMGKGVSQMLPIIARVLAATGAHTGIIEQPEIHLHPAAQAELGDLFVDHISEYRRSQLLVETHSEHLLLRIRRRIALGHIEPHDVAVIYVSRGDSGESVAKLLNINALGQFDAWPVGFFEEGFNEALAISAAADARIAGRKKATKVVVRKRAGSRG
jgi:predicted ATPase